MAANWSELPDGLLDNIFKRLVVSDHLSFMSVCSGWRSGVAHSNTLVRGYGGRKFVGLVVPGKSAHSETRRLLQPTLQSSEIYYDDDGTDVLNIAVPHQYHCCGSKYGWLVLVDDSLDMHLFNPLSGSKIQLPSVTTANPLAWRVDKAGKFIVNKAFLSHNPSSSPSETFLLMIYYGVDMAFCRLGSDSWTVIEPLNDCRYNSDAIYYNDKFYVVYNPGGLVTIDIHTPSEEGHVVQIEYARKPPGEIFVQNRYLVESNGDLFQIRRIERHIDDDDDYPSSYYTDSDDDGGGGNGNHGVDNNDNVNNNDGAAGGGGSDDDNGNQTADNNDVAGGGGGDDDNGNQNADNDGDGDNEDNIVSSGGEADDMEKRLEEARESLRSYRTKKFKIFKLRQCSCCKKQTWQRVKSIGDRAFFIGYHGSISVSASELLGCRPNSIYFTDNNVYRLPKREPVHHDIGVYSLEDNSVREVYPIHSKPVWPTAFWFSPFRGETR